MIKVETEKGHVDLEFKGSIGELAVDVAAIISCVWRQVKNEKDADNFKAFLKNEVAKEFVFEAEEDGGDGIVG